MTRSSKTRRLGAIILAAAISLSGWSSWAFVSGHSESYRAVQKQLNSLENADFLPPGKSTSRPPTAERVGLTLRVGLPIIAVPVNLDLPFNLDFRLAAGRWMPEYDYLWLAAQCQQESSWNPLAVSHAGAKGICQFMPGTWTDAQLALGFVASPFSAKHNIRAAGWYMSRMLRTWSSRKRTSMEMLPLAQASYNCGTGCVLKAQRKANDARDFPEIAEYLPAEAREYPWHIRRRYLDL